MANPSAGSFSRVAIITACSLLTVLYGCTPRRITTTWKPDHVLPASYNRILVVGILPEKDSLLRKQIEKDLSNSLQQLGYQAIPANIMFGLKGLSDLGQENTYLKLCSNDIDAVLTVALVRETKESLSPAGKIYEDPNSYYYTRIWSYKHLQADESPATIKTEYFWEAILFDLAALEAAATFKTRPFTTSGEAKVTNDLARLLTKKLTREDV